MNLRISAVWLGAGVYSWFAEWPTRRPEARRSAHGGRKVVAYSTVQDPVLYTVR